MKKIAFFASWMILLLPLSLLTAALATANSTQSDPRLWSASGPNQPMSAASSAPDAFGYTYQDEVETDGPTFGFIDISSPVNNLNLDDDDHANIPSGALLGFDFEFYGTPVSELRVSNNGAIMFNATTGKVPFTNVCPLSSAITNNIIAPWWDDWGDGGDVFWEVQGAAPNRRLIVQWHNMVHFDDIGQDDTVTFEAILFETSNVILFQYLDTTAGADILGSLDFGNSGTVGIRGGSGANSLQYEACNSPVLQDGRAIRFQHSSITITKDANPDAAQDFSFTTTFTSSTLTLDDDADGTFPNTSTFFLLPTSGITVTESAPPSPWGLANLTCASTLAAVSGFTGTTSTFTPTLGTRTVDTNLAPGDEVSCTFTNQNFGTIVVEKATNPASDPQDFSFTTDITGTFSLDTDGLDATLPISQTFTNLIPGSYFVQENALSDWDLTDLTCDDPTATINLGNRRADINVAAGETITCTFTNTKRGTIVVQKATNPASDPQVFTFTTTLTPSTFALDTDPGSVTPTSSRTFTAVVSGTYTVQEDPTSGWNLTGLACDDGSSVDLPSRTATIGLSPGETVTCVFTNTKRGTIEIVKDALPDHPQDFDFTSSDALAIPPFSLDDDSDIFLPNNLSFSVSPSVYTVTETAVPNWTLTNLACNDGDSTVDLAGRAASINVAAGEAITCTFTNLADPGILIVEKVTNPTSDPQVFTFTTTVVTTPTFTLDTNSGSATPVSQTLVISTGTYSVSENTLPDWDLTATGCSDGSAINNIDVAPGETVTCTFTNTKRGTIVIQKVTSPGNDPQVFAFSSDMPGNSSFTLDTDPFSVIPTDSLTVLAPPGVYTVTESLVPGWDLADLTCIDTVVSDSSGNVGTRTATITVSSDETVTCTFTNAKRGIIQIIKDAVPNDPQDFAFTSTISASFSLDDDGASGNPLSNSQTFSNLMTGSYLITETLPVANWSLSGINCIDLSGGTSVNIATGQANIALAPGETVTCTYTNQAAPATLTIQKVTNPASDPQVFTFTTTFPTTPTFTLDTDSGSATPVSQTFTITPGTYSINENPLSGWDLTGATCDDGSSPNNLSLSPNETVTCTFTNTKRGTIVVNKITNPASHPQDFAFTSPNLGGFSLDTDSSDGILPSSRSFVVQPGTYTVTETTVSAWNLTGLSCSDPSGGTSVVSPTVTIGLAPGETVTCDFTNTAQPGSITITKNAIPDDQQDFGFALTSAVTNTTFSLDDDGASGNPLSNTVTFPNLPLGTYTVIEGATAGWALTNLVCNDPSGGTTTQPSLGIATIALAPGENVSCTFTNTFNNVLGSITIVKSAVPSSTQSFTFTGTLGTFSLIDNDTPANTQNFLNLSAGAYSVTEGSVSGWNLSGLSCNDPDNGSITNLGARNATIDLDQGENVTCTFTNTQSISVTSYIFLPIIMRDFIILPNLTSTLTVNTSVNPPLITVVVSNIGNAPIDEPFWVDFYVNPSTPPSSLTGADRRWQRVSTQGIAWPVTTPIGPGGSLTLTSSGGFDPVQSNWGTPLPSGVYNFYAFADSFDNNDPTGPLYVEVQESNENDNESSTTGVSISSLGLEINQSDLPDPAEFPPRGEP